MKVPQWLNWTYAFLLMGMAAVVVGLLQGEEKLALAGISLVGGAAGFGGRPINVNVVYSIATVTILIGFVLGPAGLAIGGMGLAAAPTVRNKT